MKRICYMCGKECSGHICRECYQKETGRSEATRKGAKRLQQKWRDQQHGV